MKGCAAWEVLNNIRRSGEKTRGESQLVEDRYRIQISAYYPLPRVRTSGTACNIIQFAHDEWTIYGLPAVVLIFAHGWFLFGEYMKRLREEFLGGACGFDFGDNLFDALIDLLVVYLFPCLQYRQVLWIPDLFQLSDHMVVGLLQGVYRSHPVTRLQTYLFLFPSPIQ